MFIKSIRVVNFRNLKPFMLDLDKGFNVFFGWNAQGKTNLLEAVVTLSDGRSFRRGKILEMIQQEKTEAVVEGEVITEHLGEILLKVHFHRGGRTYYVNGKVITDLKEYLGKVNYIVFSAEFLHITDGEAKMRRDFLDRGVFSLNPRFLLLLKDYNKVLKSRNKSLKQDPPDLDLIQAWTEQLVEFGSRIVDERLDYVRKIKEKAEIIYKDISGREEDVDINYKSCYLSKGQLYEKAEHKKEWMAEKLKRDTSKEVEKGITFTGPHRDDLEIHIKGRDARGYGSRGQRRTAVIALKLAEMYLFQEERKERPVLVIDDIASELDRKRRNTLIDLIPENTQVLISNTDRLDYKWKDMKFYRVFGGEVYDH